MKNVDLFHLYNKLKILIYKKVIIGLAKIEIF